MPLGTNTCKIRNLDELRPGSGATPCRWVLAVGPFRFLDSPLIQTLLQAKAKGDALVLLLEPLDDPEDLSQALAQLECVDAILRSTPLLQALKVLRPVAFLEGRPPEVASGHRGLYLEETRLLKEIGCLILQLPHPVHGKQLHSNPLVNFDSEVNTYLEDLASTFDPEDFQSCLDDMAKLRVLVVGETIVDEYHYCETLGKSGKEPILVTKFLEAERFAGGVLAIVNNLAPFKAKVELLSVLGRKNGEPDPTENFVRSSLHPSIQAHFLYQDEAPTILKRRFLENYPLQKMFEVYYIKHMDQKESVAEELARWLEAHLRKYDVVIVADYGHGMITPQAVDILCAQAKFLAVNTQTNADNQGFNTISKYPKADFVSLSEKELRLEVRNRQRPTEELIEEVALKMSCRSMLVTRGSKGNLIYSPVEGCHAAPSLSQQIVDRVGAGDAVFALASLLVAQGASPRMVSFVGNVVGAHAVMTVGHRKSLEPQSLMEHIRSLLE